MIEMPTFWFPSGAGVSPGLTVSNHGEPDPTATFRFAEPVYIEPQQNFRVEMAFPQGVPGVDAGELQQITKEVGSRDGPAAYLGRAGWLSDTRCPVTGGNQKEANHAVLK